jgi:hypothetical protein
MSMGYVYFAYCSTLDAFKIGFSSNVTNRIRQLQTGRADKLLLCALLPGCRHVEKSLHSMFAGSRMHGEWFASTPELLAFQKDCREHYDTYQIDELFGFVVPWTSKRGGVAFHPFVRTDAATTTDMMAFAMQGFAPPETRAATIRWWNANMCKPGMNRRVLSLSRYQLPMTPDDVRAELVIEIARAEASVARYTSTLTELRQKLAALDIGKEAVA